ncbi:MAG: hypothetical protein RIQ78_349 [Bacteroidota bacterium]|jgi:hypothetical protein
MGCAHSTKSREAQKTVLLSQRALTEEVTRNKRVLSNTNAQMQST